MNFKNFTIALTLTLLSNFLNSQAIVSISPAFPTENDPVTITYNAALGNAQLVDLPLDQKVYAHTGVTLVGSNNWQYVVGNWATADNRVEMTRIGTSNLYTLTIQPSIRAWYQTNNNSSQTIPAGSQISQLAMVFRNVDGSKEGKTATNGDIFVPISDGNFNAAITSNNQSNVLVANTATLSLIGQSSQNAELKFFVNGVEEIAASASNSLTYNLVAGAFSPGLLTVVFSANNGPTVINDTLLVTVHSAPEVQAIPNGRTEGVTIVNNSTIYLQLRAPFKQFVYVLGDFNNWTFDPQYQMKRSPDNQFFWIELTGLDANTEYRFQYSIDFADLRTTDPFVEKILDPWNDPFVSNATYPNLIPYPTGKADGIVGVLQINQPSYSWDNSYTYNKPPKEDLIIYELLVRDFDAQKNFQSVINRLPYFKALNINAIHFMPLMEFDGNESWGYSTNFFMALDKFYGTKNKFKELVDSCHKNGIAVILDVVYNHCAGQAPMAKMYFANGQPTTQNPWLNPIATHPFSVFYDFNHESQATKYLVKKSMKHWIQEYKLDGFRFDLSKGFTQTNTGGNVGTWSQYDQSRVNIINDYVADIRSYSPSAYIILEHLGAWNEEKVYGDNGMMCWVKGTDLYSEAAMGYINGNNQNFYEITTQRRGWDNDGMVQYAESHDEERIAYKVKQFGNQANGGYNVRNNEIAMTRCEMVAPFIILLQGGAKMFWQFGELGYDFSINWCPNGTISENCRTGNKPVRWDYYNQASRRRVFESYRKANYLKKTYPVFRNRTPSSDLQPNVKRILYQSPQLDAIVHGNFDIYNRDVNPGFTKPGRWYDFISGDSIQVNDPGMTMNYAPGEYHIWLDRKVTINPNNYLISNIENAENEFEESPVVFPNPTTDFVNISLPLRTYKNLTIQMSDLSGRVVLNKFVGQTSPAQLLSFDVNELPKGIYILRMNEGNSSKTFKFVKQ